MKILTPKPVPGNKVDNLISELIFRVDSLLEHVRKIDEILSNHPISTVDTDITPGENSVICENSYSSYVTKPSFSPEFEEVLIEATDDPPLK